MPRVIVADLYAFKYLYILAVAGCPEQRQRSQHILSGIERNIFSIISSALALAVSPLRLSLLYMSGIPEHYIAKLAGSFSRVDRPAVSVCNQERQLACMIDMSVCNYYCVDISRRYRYFDILEKIDALFHAAVYYYIFAAHLKQRARARDFMRSSDKCYSHDCPP